MSDNSVTAGSTVCAQPGCDRRQHARGLCNTHYAAHMVKQRILRRWQPQQHVDATGSIRRLRALAALGWRGDDLGITGEAKHVMNARHSTVTAATAQQITEAYDRLSMTPGPSPIARRRAAAKGWLPPLAWDDDRIDDPAYEPDADVRYEPPQPIRGNRRLAATFPQQYDDLVDRGLTDAEIADWFEITPDALRLRVKRLIADQDAADDEQVA